MFYQTVLQKIGMGGAVDVEGRQLLFIGYMPVDVGDTVWTDGRVIFGNVPPKDTSLIPALPKGVPVVGNDLCGYINRSGKYKEKNIIVDDWILNDKRLFGHGTDSEDVRVIEAEIIETELNKKNWYLVTDGFYRKNQCIKYNNYLFLNYHSADPNVLDSTIAYAIHAYVEPRQGEEITLGIESPDIDKPIKIWKDDSIIQEISLKKYADFITEKCQLAEQDLMSLSNNSGVNFFKQPAPLQSFIASSYARIVSFRLNKEDDWDAIIFAAAYGYCFPYDTMEGSAFEGTFNEKVGAKKTFSEDLMHCLEYLEVFIFEEDYYSFLEITKYPKFSGTKKVDDEYTDSYKKYIEDKLQYYIPLVRFQWSWWFTVTYGASCLLRVHNGEIVSIIRLKIDGGNSVEHFIEWNETYREFHKKSQRFRITPYIEQNNWTFPLTDGFYCNGYGNVIQNVCDSEKNVIADLTSLNMNIGEYVEMMYPLRSIADHIDSEAIKIAKRENLLIEAVWGCDILKISRDYKVLNNNSYSYFYEEYHDLHEEYYHNLRNKKDYYFIDGYFDEKSNDGFFRFNPCICNISDKVYLFGVKDGELFSKCRDSENFEKIDEGLKNLRLREMKNLNKAKGKERKNDLQNYF